MKICHFTSVHKSLDGRIFFKECVSLAKAGYEVYLVAEGESFIRDGVQVVGCGEKGAGRFSRMFRFAKKVYKQARALDCDVYHFHDPELLPYALKLKKAGKTVIYDAHEETPAQILTKSWVPRPLRGFLSRIFAWYERRIARRLDAVVAAYAHLQPLFLSGGCKHVVTVENYPIAEKFLQENIPWEQRRNAVCYVGGISIIRGIIEMVQAAYQAEVPLVLAGPIESEHLYEQIKSMPEFRNVEYLGVVEHSEIAKIYGAIKIGLVTLHPCPNYLEAPPTKTFEYMASGMAVVSSDFPLYKSFIYDNGVSGICVNPLDVDQITAAIRSILNDPETGREMSRVGKEKVAAHYSWESQKTVLISLYQSLQQEQK